MYIFEPSTRFRRQYKKLNQNDRQMAKALIDKLLNDEILEPKYRDHKLIGQYEGFRECHIRPDLLLIYKKEERVCESKGHTKKECVLILTCLAIGSHSELF